MAAGRELRRERVGHRAAGGDVDRVDDRAEAARACSANRRRAAAAPARPRRRRRRRPDRRPERPRPRARRRGRRRHRRRRSAAGSGAERAGQRVARQDRDGRVGRAGDVDVLAVGADRDAGGTGETVGATGRRRTTASTKVSAPVAASRLKTATALSHRAGDIEVQAVVREGESAGAVQAVHAAEAVLLRFDEGQQAGAGVAAEDRHARRRSRRRRRRAAPSGLTATAEAPGEPVEGERRLRRAVDADAEVAQLAGRGVAREDADAVVALRRRVEVLAVGRERRSADVAEAVDAGRRRRAGTAGT